VRSVGVAALLSIAVLVGCGAWYHSLTSGNGPDRSVDLRPLAPMLVAVACLAVIWLVAALAWLLRMAARHEGPERTGQ